MPTPSSVKEQALTFLEPSLPKEQEAVSQEWLLEVLDRKFQEQEEALSGMLERKSFGSFRYSDSKLTLPRGGSNERCELKSILEEPKSGEEAAAAPPRKRSTRLGVTVMSEKFQPDPPLKSFVKGPLDVCMGLVVFVNLGFMIMMTQWQGARADASLADPTLDTSAFGLFSEQFFETAELVFFSMYLLDVLVRIVVLRKEWYMDPREGLCYLNIFDACVVCVNAFELILLPVILNSTQDSQTNSIRLIKLMRIVRTLRIVKTVTAFRQLRLLVGTCLASIGALFWSMVLLMVLKVGFALIICQALQSYILDPGQDPDTRALVNQLYGSFLKSLYTMFELTHSGSWPAVVRPVVERVSSWYAVLFLSYITLVVFAVIRIVTALFLKETLASAANDADLVMEENKIAALQAQKKLEELFHAADDDGDGNLSPAEFTEALSLPSVQSFLQLMDVSIRDCRPLFDILDDGDGQITISEFCRGLMQLKGQARALDLVVLQRENAKLLRTCNAIGRHLAELRADIAKR